MTAVQARITDRISSHHPLGLPTASGTSVNSAWGRDGARRERDQDDSVWALRGEGPGAGPGV